MTATLTSFTASKTIRPAIDAFDIDAVCKANIASSRVVNVTGKYAVEFDDVVTIGGRKINVKVLYSNNNGEIDVYRLNENVEPVAPEMAHGLPPEDYQRLFGDAEKMLFEQEAENREEAREAHGDQEYHCVKECGE